VAETIGVVGWQKEFFEDMMFGCHFFQRPHALRFCHIPMYKSGHREKVRRNIPALSPRLHIGPNNHEPMQFS